MRLLLIVLTIVWHATLGQVENSLSVDKQDILRFSIDTLVQTIKNKKKIERIVIECDSSSFNSLPKTIANKLVVKYTENRKGRAKDIRDSDIVVKVKGQGLIQNQLSIFLVTFEKRRGGLGFVADGAYKFFYTHSSDTSYRLTRIESGVVL